MNLCEWNGDAEPLQLLPPGKVFPKDSSTQLNLQITQTWGGEKAFYCIGSECRERNLQSGAGLAAPRPCRGLAVPAPCGPGGCRM